MKYQKAQPLKILEESFILVLNSAAEDYKRTKARTVGIIVQTVGVERAVWQNSCLSIHLFMFVVSGDRSSRGVEHQHISEADIMSFWTESIEMICIGFFLLKKIFHYFQNCIFFLYPSQPNVHVVNVQAPYDAMIAYMSLRSFMMQILSLNQTVVERNALLKKLPLASVLFLSKTRCQTHGFRRCRQTWIETVSC